MSAVSRCVVESVSRVFERLRIQHTPTQCVPFCTPAEFGQSFQNFQVFSHSTAPRIRLMGSVVAFTEDASAHTCSALVSELRWLHAVPPHSWETGMSGVAAVSGGVYLITWCSPSAARCCTLRGEGCSKKRPQVAHRHSLCSK